MGRIAESKSENFYHSDEVKAKKNTGYGRDEKPAPKIWMESCARLNRQGDATPGELSSPGLSREQPTRS
ncbi:MAG: hypothetical protein K0S45_242 [Nitrospira sp.]|nr:hypothetical protein [Nitrospira sp.]